MVFTVSSDLYQICLVLSVTFVVVFMKNNDIKRPILWFCKNHNKYFQSISCWCTTLKNHISFQYDYRTTCFRPKVKKSRCIHYNNIKIRYINPIYVFNSHTVAISFSFTFVSIHAGLPYCHMFTAAHCDIRLNSSVIFYWNLHDKVKQKEQLKCDSKFD